MKIKKFFRQVWLSVPYLLMSAVIAVVVLAGGAALRCLVPDAGGIVKWIAAGLAFLGAVTGAVDAISPSAKEMKPKPGSSHRREFQAALDARDSLSKWAWAFVVLGAGIGIGYQIRF